MKKLPMVSFALALTVSVAQGASLRYTQSGDWFAVNPANANTNGWLNATVPGSTDTARANWADNTITLSSVAPTVDRFQFGVDESGGLVVENGGVLTSLRGSRVGNNNLCEGRLTINTGGVVNVLGWLMIAGDSLVTGKVTINGGELNIDNHLWMATGADSIGVLELNRGTVNVSGILGVGTVDFFSGGGVGTVNVNGGVLALNSIHSSTANGVYLPSVQPGSIINITGSGLITLPGDFTGTIQNYVTEGKITAYDGLGTIITDLHNDAGFISTWVWANNSSQTNLLVNSGFESSGTGWTEFGNRINNIHYERGSGSGPLQGILALKLWRNPSGNPNEAGVYQDVDVMSNSSYEFRGYLRNGNGVGDYLQGDNAAFLRIIWLDGSNSEIASIDHNIPPAGIDSSTAQDDTWLLNGFVAQSPCAAVR